MTRKTQEQWVEEFAEEYGRGPDAQELHDWINRDRKPMSAAASSKESTMTFTMNPKGTPLPAGHPLKGCVIVFGGRKPIPPTPPAPQQETNLDQVAHDQRMAQQTPEQRAAMVKGLGALARSKLAETGEPDAEPT